ncbi:hypothetical protein [Peribacillus alkalitolerans]|uniref:hypothetical protein n=1 Tax=Peribacillus alkalitolerans TaxID=1550385 RepID=UPI0013D4680C|nr:hypothetical protein [Peribacillus alkalitolerans]
MYYHPYPYNPYVSPAYYYPSSNLVPPNFVPVHYNSYYQHGHEIRTPEMYPPIDTQELHKSAQIFQKLIRQTDLIVKKIISSDKFARDLMESAQKSDQKKVDQLILSTGITIKHKVTFSPDGINIKLHNGDNDGDCCTLVIALRW